jgi:hypothetical protein
MVVILLISLRITLIYFRYICVLLQVEHAMLKSRRFFCFVQQNYIKSKVPCLINAYILHDVFFLVRSVALRNVIWICSVPCKVRMSVDRIAHNIFRSTNITIENNTRAGRRNCLSFYKSRVNVLLKWTEYLECLAVLTPAKCTAARKLFDEKLKSQTTQLIYELSNSATTTISYANPDMLCCVFLTTGAPWRHLKLQVRILKSRWWQTISGIYIIHAA